MKLECRGYIPPMREERGPHQGPTIRLEACLHLTYRYPARPHLNIHYPPECQAEDRAPVQRPWQRAKAFKLHQLFSAKVCSGAWGCSRTMENVPTVCQTLGSVPSTTNTHRLTNYHHEGGRGSQWMVSANVESGVCT